jgi:hypothetical protein
LNFHSHFSVLLSFSHKSQYFLAGKPALGSEIWRKTLKVSGRERERKLNRVASRKKKKKKKTVRAGRKSTEREKKPLWFESRRGSLFHFGCFCLKSFDNQSIHLL